jgi:hypothetical protein
MNKNQDRKRYYKEINEIFVDYEKGSINNKYAFKQLMLINLFTETLNFSCADQLRKMFPFETLVYYIQN